MAAGGILDHVLVRIAGIGRNNNRRIEELKTWNLAGVGAVGQIGRAHV